MRLGEAALERLSGAPGTAHRVHSVFHRAVNIVCHDGRLVTLHGPGLLAAPFAAAVVSLPPRGALAPGMALPASMLDWRDAERASLTMPAGPLAYRPEALGAATGAAALGSVTGRRAQSRLARALAARDADRVAAAALGLVGFGEGLTPAGDDCLVGALAAVHRLAAGWLAARPALRARLAEAAVGRTTAIAREFLLHALEGRFAEPVLQVLAAGSEEAAGRAASRLVAMGATSGADTLAGIRLACKALAKRRVIVPD